MSAEKKVRAIGYTVIPQLVVDDGEHLTPLQVQPLNVPAHEWDQWVKTGLTAALADLQAQANAGSPEDETGA